MGSPFTSHDIGVEVLSLDRLLMSNMYKHFKLRELLSLTYCAQENPGKYVRRPSDEGCTISHCFKWGVPLFPNDVGVEVLALGGISMSNMHIQTF